MSINPEIQRKFKTNPLGLTFSIILIFLLVYFLQSTVGPFAGNNTSLMPVGQGCAAPGNSSYTGYCVVQKGIVHMMRDFWNNSNWLLKIVWPLLGAFLVIGFLLDDQRTQRLRPIVIRIGQRAGGRLARTRAGQLTVATIREGQRVKRRGEEELEQFEEEEPAE